MERWIYRSVTQYDELRRLSELQGTAWPADVFTSAAHMKAAVMHGGAVIAAYDGETPAGFCYGFAAFNGKETYFHSHMMVVQPDYRDQGLGTRLKLEQRLWAIERGYPAITWTYDPFQLRNGFLNVCKLGGTVNVYLPAVYGIDGLTDPSDRFLVRWELESPRVRAAVRGQYSAESRWSDYAVLLGNVAPRGESSGERLCGDRPLREPESSERDFSDEGYLLAVPQDAAGLKRREPAVIVDWKRRLRAVCERAFEQGCRIVGLLPGDEAVGYYVLERKRDS